MRIYTYRVKMSYDIVVQAESREEAFAEAQEVVEKENPMESDFELELLDIEGMR